jgi:NADH dehydrogenase/NADH:ubiquinone oxidoreductase subunit G
MITIRIDDREVTCDKGEYLLDVARRNGIHIPSLCYHEGLLGIGSCRVCICEVTERGRTRVVTSCVYPIERECEVFTASPRIREQRGVILTLLARLAPNSEEIHKLARDAGVDLPRLKDKEDGDTCILCGLCTAACETLGAGAIAKADRGVAKEIATPYHEPSAECIGCCSCAAVCPTKSIPVQETGDVRVIWGREFKTVRCEVCGAVIGTEESLAYAEKRAGRQEALEGRYQTDRQAQRLCSRHRMQQVAAGLIVEDDAAERVRELSAQ